jgi:hypothetical protein
MKMNPSQLNEEVASKAKEFLNYFKTITRHGSEQEIYILEDDAPAALEELVQNAHGDFFPDDFRYKTIYSALSAFADCNTDPEEVRLEADIYTYDLTRWLGSNLRRVSYCDEAQSKFGLEKVDVITLISYGQQVEKDEIVALVREALISLCT